MFFLQQTHSSWENFTRGSSHFHCLLSSNLESRAQEIDIIIIISIIIIIIISISISISINTGLRSMDFFQDVKFLSTSPPGETLSWGSRVWDFRLVK